MPLVARASQPEKIKLSTFETNLCVSSFIIPSATHTQNKQKNCYWYERKKQQRARSSHVHRSPTNPNHPPALAFPAAEGNPEEGTNAGQDGTSRQTSNQRVDPFAMFSPVFSPEGQAFLQTPQGEAMFRQIFYDNAEDELDQKVYDDRLAASEVLLETLRLEKKSLEDAKAKKLAILHDQAEKLAIIDETANKLHAISHQMSGVAVLQNRLAEDFKRANAERIRQRREAELDHFYARAQRLD